MSVVILSTTAPTLLLNPNPRRKRLALQMQPTDVDANNTGRIHIGLDFQPVATSGHPSQGEIMLQGAAIEYPTGGGIIPDKYKGAVWATSSQNTQSITVEEEAEK